MDKEDEDQSTDYNSEFDSADEDAEFALYANLYFDPNPDASSEVNKEPYISGNGSSNVIHSEPREQLPETAVPSVKDSTNSVQDGGSMVESSKDRCRLLEKQTLVSEISMISSPNLSQAAHEQLDNGIPASGFVEGTKDRSRLQEQQPIPSEALNLNHNAPEQLENGDTASRFEADNGILAHITVSTPLTGVDVCKTVDTRGNANQKQGRNDSSNNHGVNSSNIKLFSDVSRAVDRRRTTNHKQEKKASPQILDVNISHNNCVAPSGRERLSSLCSEGSIPGNLPLDELYFNVPPADNVAEAELEDKLKMFDKKKEKEYQETRNKTKSRKRKRSLTEDDNVRDGVEDSRCDSLTKLKGKKNAKAKTENEEQKSSSSGSDSDKVYILGPPSSKQYETLTISSTNSETEDVDRMSMYKDKTNKSHKSADKGPANITNSSKIDTVAHVSLTEILRRKINGPAEDTISLISLDSDGDSSSDSDYDMLDFDKTSGTNLTLNVHKDLSQIISGLFSKQDTEKSRKQSTRPVTESIKPSYDYTRRRPNSKKVPSCTKWTQEMVNFYDSDVSEEFDVSAIQQQQSNSKADWHIIREDLYGSSSSKGRYYSNQERCTICRQFGHRSHECKRVPRCHLCSDTSHTQRHQCPKNCCFRCGDEYHAFCYDTTFSTRCHRCDFKGHASRLCPSLWRDYHLTTSGLIAETSGSATVMNRYCYMCAQRGHFGHECPARYARTCPYPLVSQEVHCYVEEPMSSGDVQIIYPEEEKISRRQKFTMVPLTKRQKLMLRHTRGVLLKEIEKVTGAKIVIRFTNRTCQVCINGSRDAQSQAKEMLELKLQEIGSKRDTMLLESRHRSLNWGSQFLQSLTKGMSKDRILMKLRSFKDQLHQPQFLSRKDFKRRFNRLEILQRNIMRNAAPYAKRTVQEMQQDLKKLSISVASNDESTFIDHFISEVAKCNGDPLTEEVCKSISEYVTSVFHPSLEDLDRILERASVHMKYQPYLQEESHKEKLDKMKEKEGKLQEIHIKKKVREAPALMPKASKVTFNLIESQQSERDKNEINNQISASVMDQKLTEQVENVQNSLPDSKNADNGKRHADDSLLENEENRKLVKTDTLDCFEYGKAVLPNPELTWKRKKEKKGKTKKNKKFGVKKIDEAAGAKIIEGCGNGIQKIKGVKTGDKKIKVGASTKKIKRLGADGTRVKGFGAHTKKIKGADSGVKKNQEGPSIKKSKGAATRAKKVKRIVGKQVKIDDVTVKIIKGNGTKVKKSERIVTVKQKTEANSAIKSEKTAKKSKKKVKRVVGKQVKIDDVTVKIIKGNSTKVKKSKRIVTVKKKTEANSAVKSEKTTKKSKVIRGKKGKNFPDTVREGQPSPSGIKNKVPDGQGTKLVTSRIKNKVPNGQRTKVVRQNGLFTVLL